MINLLPPETKESYVYARRNVALRRWLISCLVAIVGMGGVATYGLLSIQQTTVDLTQQVAATETSLKNQNFTGTQAQIQDISNSFKLVLKVLGQEVLFSQVLKQIATSIPSNANLTALNISQVQGGIDISAVATDYTTASQVQVNLADPANKLFSKADLVSIACNDAAAADKTYPCTVTVRALFAPNNPFLFINSKATKP